jgi:hypothetical protein
LSVFNIDQLLQLPISGILRCASIEALDFIDVTTTRKDLKPTSYLLLKSFIKPFLKGLKKTKIAGKVVSYQNTGIPNKR